MSKDEKNKNLSLYDCASLFAESMHEQFPNGCPKGTSLFMVATNHKTLAYLMEGSNDSIVDMIAQLSISDRESLNIIGEGVVKAINHLKRKQDELNQTAQ